MTRSNNFIEKHLFSQIASFSDSTSPEAIVQKLFLTDATVFGLFKAILKTVGRHNNNGRKKKEALKRIPL
jgi:hypothetical protein